MRGATSQQVKSRSSQTAHESCRNELFNWWTKPLRQSSYDFHQILAQRLQKWAQRWGTQPFQSKEIKISSTVWFTRFTKELSSRQWFIKFQKQVPLFNRPKSREKHPRQAVPTANQKGIFQPMLHFWYKKELLNCQRPHLKPPSRDFDRTVYTAENLFFTSFLQRWNSMILG